MAEDAKVIQYGKLHLKSKPTAMLSYSYIPSNNATKTLVVFLNGLLLPRSGWEPTMRLLSQKNHELDTAFLAYDRFGQGESDRDPTDNPTHSFDNVVQDLYQFLRQFGETELSGHLPWEKHDGRLVFVCNSIGCPIARLFAQAYPSTVSAFVFLDSMIANTDFVSIFPDPDAAGFDKDQLAKDITVDDLRNAREVFRQFFHPSLPNKERLDRSNAAQLLPYADLPKLSPDVAGRGPLVSVVGHDWDFFAAENKRSFGLPEGLFREYMNPHWHRYNIGLTQLTQKQWSKGPVIAKGCGHFIQRDDPEFVALEVMDILERVRGMA